MYSVVFQPDARRRLAELDKSVRLRIYKKVAQLESEGVARHLKHGLSFFVAEVGGYRLAFTVEESEKTKTVWFVGDHKQYEKWFRSVEL